MLDFDTESRPLSYLGSDFTTGEITAIAASWVGEKKVACWLLGDVDQAEMLAGFRALYDQADIVTGHYIIPHDLPILNGSFLEAGLPTLGPKLVSDTKVHLIKRRQLSASQGSLAEMLGVPAEKYAMTQPKWREANRLTPAGLKETRKRVVDDVRQHKLLRERLIAVGALKPPRLWSP